MHDSRTSSTVLPTVYFVNNPRPMRTIHSLTPDARERISLDRSELGHSLLGGVSALGSN